MSYLQRKYIDLIHQVSSKWVNWDPPIPIQVGAFGEVESETGELRIEGNIYDADFQTELNKLGLRLQMTDYPPQEGEIEDDFIIASKGAKRVDLEARSVIASFKGQWQFEQGKRGALLIIRRPRVRSLPRDVILDVLYKVPKLKDKWLVTSVHTCPAFCMYLSDKSGEKVSLALVLPGISEGATGWWSNTQSDLLRKACDKAGMYTYTPLYTMKRRMGWQSRLFRDGQQTAIGDDLWDDAAVPPWDPFDEDGNEDVLNFTDGDEIQF